MDEKELDEGASTGRIRTNFFERQAEELSAPASKRGPIRVLLAIIGIAIAFGLYQLAMYFLNYDKLMAMKNVEVTFQKPAQKDGQASVSVNIDNYNAFSVKNVQVNYTILSSVGKELTQGTIAIPYTVPAGDSRVFANIKLAPIGENAGRMQAELVGIDMGKKTDLTPELQAQFAEDSAMQDKDALNAFRQFVVSAPNFAPGFVELGLAYAANGDFTKAIDSYQKALKLDPENSNAYFNMGVAEFYKKDFDNAKKSFAEASRLQPDDPTITDAQKQLDASK